MRKDISIAKLKALVLVDEIIGRNSSHVKDQVVHNQQ